MLAVEEPTRGARPHSHTVAEQVKAGHTWTKGRVHLASRRKNRRDLDTQGLPDGCKTLGRGRETTDRTGDIRGRTLSLLRTDVLCSQHRGGRRCARRALCEQSGLPGTPALEP